MARLAGMRLARLLAKRKAMTERIAGLERELCRRREIDKIRGGDSERAQPPVRDV